MLPSGEKRGDTVKILFDCSFRDDTLQQYQAYIRTGIMTKNRENGDLFQKDLAEMVKGLQENIPGIGIYCILRSSAAADAELNGNGAVAAAAVMRC